MTPPSPLSPRFPSQRTGLLRLGAALVTLAVGVAGACVDGRLPTEADFGGASLALQPTFPPGTGSGGAGTLPINRIRITVRAPGSTTPVLDSTYVVNPTDSVWPLNVGIPLGEGETRRFEITLELINRATDGTQTVEWSARQTRSVTQGTSNSTPTVPVFRGPVDNLTVDSVVIAPPPRTVLIEGDTVRVTSTVYGGGTGAKAFWDVIDSTRASVDTSGLVTTLLPGVTRIRARAGPKADTVQVTILQAVAAVSLVPDTARVPSIGDTARIVMTTVDPRGVQVAQSTTQYELLAGTTVEDLGGGRFLALENGMQRVAVRGFRTNPLGPGQQAFPNLGDTTVFDTATIVVEQQVASVDFSVDTVLFTAVGDSMVVSGVPLDAFGVEVVSAQIAWGSTDTLVAKIDSTGLVKATGAGQAFVTAKAGPTTDSLPVAVRQVVTSFGLTPPFWALLHVGDTVRLKPEAFDRNGHAVALGTIAWSSSDTLIATVNAQGLVTAADTGVAKITATTDTLEAQATVAVGRPPALVVVDPPSATAGAVGDTLTFGAVARDEGGFEILDATFAWSVADTTVAKVAVTFDTVATRGDTMFTVGVAKVVAKAAGTTSLTVVATAFGLDVADTAAVVVDLIPASVTVTPVETVLATLDDTVALTPAAFDGGGTPISGRTFTWASSNTSVATVDASGVVHAVGNGTTTITATTGSASGSATVVVSVPAASVDVTPDYRAVAVGGTGAFTGNVFDAQSRALSGVAVGWSPTDAAIATVSGAGVATGAAVGVAGVVGAVGGLADTSVVAVADGSTLISTAFIGGTPRARVAAGQQVTVTVALDMSFVGSDGDLGAAQFDLTYEQAVLTFVSASTPLGFGATNGDVPGKVSFAMISTEVQGTANVTLLTVTFEVAGASGAMSQLGLTYTDNPYRTDALPENKYALPLTVPARITVITP